MTLLFVLLLLKKKIFFYKGCRTPTKELSTLMEKLSFPEEKEPSQEEGGLLEWFSRVPGRVLGVTSSSDNKVKLQQGTTSNSGNRPRDQQQVKYKNGNLELSQREFDEVYLDFYFYFLLLF